MSLLFKLKNVYRIIFNFFLYFYLGQANSLAKKKSFESGSVYNVIQNSLPPKSKKTHENEVVESTTSAKNWNLTEDEKTLYGDRIIENYEKLELLGK